MSENANVLVINFHGGFPSCMIKKAFSQLSTFQEMKKRGDFYTRVYPTNASAGPSLHDIIMDAPLHSMIDSVWHDWSHVRQTSRSLFHVFKNKGYTTKMFGAFGLENSLDPHFNLHHYPGESEMHCHYMVLMNLNDRTLHLHVKWGLHMTKMFAACLQLL